MTARTVLVGTIMAAMLCASPALAEVEHFGIGAAPGDVSIAASGVAKRAVDLGGVRAPFNGRADHSSDVFGLYYMITGGKFVNGQTVNGDNASGGVFRFIHDDPVGGAPWPDAFQTWRRDDWFTQNAGMALTLKNGGVIVYDNNGIETHTTNGYYDDSQTSIAGLYMGFCMSNNFDWVYSGYFKLNAPTEIDTIVGYFDGTGFYGQFDPGNPAIGYRMNIFSSYYDGIHPMPTNTGSFDGDVFSSDVTPGTFTWSDTGEVRVYSGWPAGTTDPIYRLTYELDTPITLPAGEYFFSHDAIFTAPPEVQVDDDWSILGDGVIVDVDGVDYTIGYNAFDTIQEGIDAVAQGGIVHVQDGTYNENININKHLQLIGAGSGTLRGPVTTITQTPAGAGDPKVGVIQLAASGASAANPILIQDLRVEPIGMAGISVGRFYEATGTLVEYVELDNVKVIGTNTNPSTEQERGLYVDNTSTLRHLSIQHCAFNDLTYGWYFQKEVSADTSTVEDLEVVGTTFNHNNHKGIYAEKLSDATFVDCVVDENGFDASVLPSYFQPWMAGIDINLKAGTYQNLVFECCTVTNNALGGAKEGVGLTVKGRGTGDNPSGSYVSFPAYIDNVQILGGTFTGNERGIRLGEPGKGNATPTSVLIRAANLYGNVQQYGGSDGSAYGELIDMRGTGSDQIAAIQNWWGQAGGPVAGQVYSAMTPDPDTDYGLDAPNDDCSPRNALLLESDKACYGAGEQVTIDIVLNGNEAEVTAGLFYLSYDATKLDFVSIEPGDAPFTEEEEESVDEVAGEISYTVGVPTSTPPAGYTGSAPIVMATLTFDVLAGAEECAVEDVVSWRDPDGVLETRLARLMNGLAIPLYPDALGTLGDITFDFTAPQITCPDDITVDADPGECQKTFNYTAQFDDPIDFGPDGWYVDRFAPRLFESASFDGDNRLHVQIHADDQQASSFHNYQGYKHDLNFGLGSVLSADLYVPADWADAWGGDADSRHASMWATVEDAQGDISAYPIIGFTRSSSSHGIRIWNPAEGGWVNLATPPVYGTWNHLEIRLQDSEFEYYLNGAFVGSDLTTNDTTAFRNVIIQAYNFGYTYDVYWDNISLGPYWPTVTDNCGQVTTYERSDDPGLTIYDPFPVGTTTITWTATDCAGNVATCEQTITVEDNEDPVITDCPGDINQSNDTGDCGAIVTWTGPTADDNCGIDTFTSDAAPGDFFPVGTTTVTYTATDVHGNVTTCSFDVTITDDEDPTIDCPADISQTADAGLCSAAVSVPSPVTDDNCGVASVVNDYNGTADASDVYPVGTTTVVWTVTDIYGNTAQCSMTITVTDDEFPVISNCPADITQSNDLGDCGAIVTWTAPTADDNCGVTSWTSTHNPGDSFSVGTTTVTYTAQDAAGNTTTCSFDVTITDDENPTITCPADISVSNDTGVCGANVTVPSPLTDDNCGVASVVNDYNSAADASDYYAVGTHTVTWTVTDIHGNTAQCTMTITVTDDENPVISGCPSDIVVQATAGGCDAVVTWTEPTADDNCGIATFTSTHNPGDTFDTGTTTVTYTATDVHGNETTCSFDVTVQGTNDLIVDIDLQGAVVSDVTRCITFTFFDCAGGSVEFKRDIDFTASAPGIGNPATGSAAFTFAGSDGIPCGDYQCVLVQDELHTLTRKFELGSAQFYISGGQYFINATGPGAQLLQGDLYDDTDDVGVDFIDVVDIGVYIALWGTVYPNGDTLCSDGYFAHADIDGDWVLDTSDRAFITTNYEVVGEYGCCSRSMMKSGVGPRHSITANELRAMGLGFVADRADLNADGVLNARDIDLFNSGVRPGPEDVDVSEKAPQDAEQVELESGVPSLLDLIHVERDSAKAQRR